MTSPELCEHLTAAAGDDPIVASLGHPAYDLFAARDRPANFYTWGSMGLASSVSLGLALAQPSRRVFALDGDGSLLMNLGSLASIGWTRPANLIVVVIDNERYATTGGQETATAHGTDLEAAARAMAITSASTVRNTAELDAALTRAANQPGPSIIVAKIVNSSPTTRPPLDCVFIKQRFMAAVGCPETATTGVSS
jgi:thiamine pyrophosphate-dependent acetolactate synthase large subunit-like protein